MVPRRANQVIGAAGAPTRASRNDERGPARIVLAQHMGVEGLEAID